MPQFVEDIRRAISGKHPLLYLISAEEDRVLRPMPQLARDCFGETAELLEWTCVDGLAGHGEDTRAPVAATAASSSRCFAPRLLTASGNRAASPCRRVTLLIST